MKLLVHNPYDYNTISLKKNQGDKSLPFPDEMKTDRIYNYIGKYLGVDAAKEWSTYYDKIFAIVEWAKKKSNSTDLMTLVSTIEKKISTSPVMSSKRINDVYIATQLDNPVTPTPRLQPTQPTQEPEKPIVEEVNTPYETV